MYRSRIPLLARLGLYKPDPFRKLVRRQAGNTPSLVWAIVVVHNKLGEQGHYLVVGYPRVLPEPLLERAHTAFGNPITFRTVTGYGYMHETGTCSELLKLGRHKMRPLNRDDNVHRGG